MMLSQLTELSLLCCCLLWINSVNATTPTVYLSGNQRDFSQPTPMNEANRFRIFCFKGMSKRFFFLFHSPFINLSSVPPDLLVYDGGNDSEVRSHFESSQRSMLSYWWGVAPWRTGSISLSPFVPSCIGIYSKHEYVVHLDYKVDYWRIPLFFGAIILFWHAVKLSRHDALYYSSGIGLSLVASLVLLIFILQRFLPLRRGIYALLLLSSATTLALLDFITRNLERVVLEYRNVAVVYVFIVSAVSFSVLYLMKPRVSDRSLNLVQFALQSVALATIFFASQIVELSCGVIVLMLFLYNFPRSLLHRARLIWYRFFPKRRRYMTEEEYRTTVNEATERALEDLREFCQSPECRSWMLVSRLKSPSRFASFVEGESHLLEEEEDAFSLWEENETEVRESSNDDSIDIDTSL